MRVLLVEDDEALCAATKRVLAHNGHESKCVGRMSEAPRAVSKSDFDVVILDLNLPDTQGTETLEAMKGLTDAPILVFTVDDMWAQECLRLGAREYLVKGKFTPMDIPRAVERAVNRDLLATALDRADGEGTYPGRPVDDPAKVGDDLVSLARELRVVAAGG